MKRVFSSIFLAIFLLFISIIGVKAEDMGVYIEKGSNYDFLTPGDIITVNYIIEPSSYLEESKYIKSTDISIYYDANVLEVVKNEEENSYYYSAIPVYSEHSNNISKRSYISLEQKMNEGYIEVQPGQKMILAIFKFKVKKDVLPQDIVIHNNEKDKIYCETYEAEEYENSVCALGYGNELKYYISSEEDLEILPNDEYMDGNIPTTEEPLDTETIIQEDENNSERREEIQNEISILLIISATLIVTTVLITTTIIKLTNNKSKNNMK